MIPASYVFKDIYHDRWERSEPVAEAIEPRTRFTAGLLTPIAGAVAAVLARRDRHQPAYFGGHAYE